MLPHFVAESKRVFRYIDIRFENNTDENGKALPPWMENEHKYRQSRKGGTRSTYILEPLPKVGWSAKYTLNGHTMDALVCEVKGMDEAQTKGKVVTVKHEVKLQLRENDVMTALKGEERLLRDFSQDQWKTKWTSISTLDISGKRAIEFLPPLHLPRGSGVQRKSKRDGKQFEAVFKDQQIVEVKVPKDCLPDLRDAVKTRLLHPLEKGEDGQGDLPSANQFGLAKRKQSLPHISEILGARSFLTNVFHSRSWKSKNITSIIAQSIIFIPHFCL